ncbi:MAG: hypothetical protein ABIA04_13235 [Pseudomonadota bacterium]
MLSTAKIFEYTASPIIYKPRDNRLPILSLTAPGLVGSVIAMNIKNVAIAVNMVPGNSSNPDRPGMNSSILARHIPHVSNTSLEAAENIRKTQRGVSWLYIVGDGKDQTSFVAETGMKKDNFNPLNYTKESLKKKSLLPSLSFLNFYQDKGHDEGLVFRWSDYKYPLVFQAFNEGLFNDYGKISEPSYFYDNLGFINKSYNEENCPRSYYFPPQREDKDDVILMTNHFISPSMRLTSMNPWTVMLTKKRHDESQWRYDEVNKLLLDNYGNIDEKKAIEILDLLSPYGKFPNYYLDMKAETTYNSSDGRTRLIRGSLALCDLTDGIMHIHVGFYADHWINVSLLNYF